VLAHFDAFALRVTLGNAKGRAMAGHAPTGDNLHRLPTDEELRRLQRTTVLYYRHETNPDNGLVREKTEPEAPCSIAAVGLALASIPVIVEFGIDLGPAVLMIENYRTGLIWSLIRRYPPVLAGLRAAGFTGGWL
jgi:hypothetical protein